MINFKWLRISGGEKVEVKATRSWTVRWTSRHNPYSSGSRPECEVFTSATDAERFATALREAFKLIKHTSGTEVIIQENQ